VDTLAAGNSLLAGQYLWSANGHHSLTLQPDGTLALQTGPLVDPFGRPTIRDVIWSSKLIPAPETPSVATMLPDGDLVLLDSTGAARWTSGTAGNPGAYLVVQNDRNVVIYSARPAPLWATKTSLIQHVFVLMLENRSFDHMLGHFTQPGIDPKTGGTTRANGVWPGGYSNSLGPLTIPARMGAPQRMPVSPGHGFNDVLVQLCYDPLSDPNPPELNSPYNYPTITNAGFVRNWVDQRVIVDPIEFPLHFGPPDPSIVMAGFGPSDLPVLFSLAEQFAVLDNYCSSLPGPTDPNRRFVHAASSAGLYDGQTGDAIFSEYYLDGVTFANGTIFDKLSAAGHEYLIFEGDSLPNAGELAGIPDSAFVPFAFFSQYVNNPAGYAPAYTFIEPNYGNDIGIFGPNDFSCGDSQHPDNDVTKGEALIKVVYETIRNSPVWDSSLLVITYDEHGGFYDHVAPQPAVPPGDPSPPTLPWIDFKPKFAFDKFGARVPALVISPLVAKGTIDHQLYDHTSVLRTLEDIFMLPRLTNRDASANSFFEALTVLSRDDAPKSLPSPAVSLNPEDCSGLTDTELIDAGEQAGIAILVVIGVLVLFDLVNFEEPPQAIQGRLPELKVRLKDIRGIDVDGALAKLVKMDHWPERRLAVRMADLLSRPMDPNLGQFVYVAMRREASLLGASAQEVSDAARLLQTQFDALLYLRRVATMVSAAHRIRRDGDRGRKA